MKKKLLFLLFFILLFTNCALADDKIEAFEFEEVVLEQIEPQFLLTLPPNNHIKTLLLGRIVDYQEPNLEGYTSLFSTSSGLYIEENFEIERKKKFKNFALGIKYNNKSTIEGFEQMRTLYYEYQKNNLLFKISYKENNFSLYNKDKNIAMSFAPEYKINDTLSVKYTYTEKRNKKNSDLMFSVKPFKTEDINFDFGAGQIYYDDKKPSSSQILFSTEIKF